MVWLPWSWQVPEGGLEQWDPAAGFPQSTDPMSMVSWSEELLFWGGSQSRDPGGEGGSQGLHISIPRCIQLASSLWLISYTPVEAVGVWGAA